MAHCVLRHFVLEPVSPPSSAPVVALLRFDGGHIGKEGRCRRRADLLIHHGHVLFFLTVYPFDLMSRAELSSGID
jgi:hypothetical protein